MPITIKTGLLKFKDPDTGKYIGIDVAAETKASQQLASIEAAGEAYVTSITQNGEAQMADITENGTTQMTNITQNGQAQVAAIQTTGQTQVSNIETKGADTLGSIPDDYTDLYNEVSELKSAVSGQIVIASKEITKAGAKVSANGIIQYADQNKYRCFDVDADILRQYNVMRLVLKNNTQYNMLAIFVLRDSTGAAVVTTGWMPLVDGIDIYNACFASRMTDAVKTVSITYIFSPDLVAGNAITGINELDYSFLCTKTDYALKSEVTSLDGDITALEGSVTAVQTGLATVQNDIEVLNDAIFKTVNESVDQYSETYASGSATNSVKWVPVILPPKSTVTLFQQLVHGNSTDVVKLELWEMDDDTGDYSLSNTLTATSVTKVTDYMYTLNFPGFTTEKKTLVTYADPSSAGWLRYAVDPNYSCLKFSNELTEVSETDVTSTASVKLAYKIAYSYVQEKDKSKKIVYVDANGGGDYLTVVGAVSSEPEGTVIYVLPGVYDGTVEAFNKRIILIGTDRNQCIIRSVDGRYDYPAINGSCGYLENLTLYSQYVSGTSHEIDSATSGAYAFHCENKYGVGKTLEFHHCTLISDFFPGLGVGLRKDFHLILDDCILENRQILNRGVYTDVGSLGALYFHDSNGTQGNQYVTVKNCVLRSTLGKTMTPYQVSRETQNNHVYCDFIGNVLYDAINKYSNNIWYRNDPFNESTGIFEIGIGFGNSNSGLNNNT